MHNGFRAIDIHNDTNVDRPTLLGISPICGRVGLASWLHSFAGTLYALASEVWNAVALEVAALDAERACPDPHFPSIWVEADVDA